MRCPYLEKSSVRVTVTENDLADEETGVLRGDRVWEMVRQRWEDCVERECAAWQDGRCQYRKGGDA